jgi:hypothetical protein
MGDDDEGGTRAALDGAQLELHGFAQILVERRQRLIEQQQLRVFRQRPGKRDARALTARQHRRLAITEAFHPHQRQHLRHALADQRLRRAVHAQAEADVLRHVHVREQRIGLEHHVDRPCMRRHAGHVLPIQHDPPGIRLDQPRQHAQQRGLPRS